MEPEKKKRGRPPGSTNKADRELTKNLSPVGTGGRPSDYLKKGVDKQLDLVTKFALVGLTDLQIAEHFGVSNVTFMQWKKDYPEFLDALKSGKDLADANIGNSLYQRASGFTKKIVKQGKNKAGEIVEWTETEYYPPDATSMIFWLKNRRPDQWRDQKAIDHTTKGESIKTEVDLDTAAKKRVLEQALEQLNKDE